MANDLSAVTPKILARGLLALRSMCIMPRLVNFDYSAEAAQRGATIDVPIPSAVAVQDVSPSNTPPATADSTPTSVSIPLDQWKEAPFYLTDKDLLQANNDVLPMQASEAIKSIAETINAYIINQMVLDTFSLVYTSGAHPFATTINDAINARMLLAKTLCPPSPRRMVISPEAEANALALAQFTNAQTSGSTEGLYEGNLGRKLGLDWYMDQQIGTFSGSGPFSAGAATVNGAHALGAKTLSIAKATNAHNLVRGDIITIAGDTQQYVVTAAVTLAVGNTAVSIYPGLKVAKSGSEVVSLQAAHKANLAFHRDAFAFAMRPVRDTQIAGVPTQQLTMMDNVSGLSLRLEVTREHKRYRWSFDALYGGKMIRPEFCARVSG